MNSAASRQVVMPPMPEIGRPRSRIAGDLGHHVQRDRLHRRAAIAAMRALAVDHRLGREVVEIDAVIELMVLIRRHRIRAAALRRLGRLADVGDVGRQLHDAPACACLLAPSA
jgi:hypothetical protein